MLELQHAQAHPAAGDVGVDAQRGLQVGDAGGLLVLLPAHHAAQEECVGVVALQLHGALQALHGPVVVAAHVVGAGAIVPGVGIVGVQVQGEVAVAHGLAQVALGDVHGGAAHEEARVVRVLLLGPGIVHEGAVEVALPLLDVAAELEGAIEALLHAEVAVGMCQGGLQGAGAVRGAGGIQVVLGGALRQQRAGEEQEGREKGPGHGGA